MAISFPMDHVATRQANDVFYCRFHEEPSLFDDMGQRVPLSAHDPAQQHLRTTWAEIYQDILAHNTDGSRPFPACGNDAHHHHPVDCQYCAESAGDDSSDDKDPMDKKPADDKSKVQPLDPSQSCGEEDEDDDEPRVRLRASLFFDGTGNNRTNVWIGTDFNDDASYGASETNISLMERVKLEQKAPEYDEHWFFYIEGIGTLDAKDDSTYSAATGRGGTGVIAKVEKGIEKLRKRIKIEVSDGVKIEYLHLDAFGFSRGAAGARNFVHRAVNDPEISLLSRLTDDGYDVVKVEAKFIGLYDTVASCGIAHDDDTAELHLDAIASAERVVQLAAAEEHREKFRLTNIASAANGLELFLPGVHSDIGGGYNASEDEVDWQVFDLDTGLHTNKKEQSAIDRERTWLVESGWYRSDELTETNFWNEVHATRQGISNKYSRIPLALMARYARLAGVDIAAKLEKRYPVPKGLQAVRSAIDATVTAGECGTPSRWFGNPPAQDAAWHRSLRHSHLHFSARYGESGGAHAPQFSNDDPIGGRRRRIIQEG